MAALLPIPTPPPQSLFSPRRFSRWSHAPTTLTKLPSNLTALNPPSASLVDDSSPSPVSNPVSIDAESAIEDSDKLPFSGCKACGSGELEKGCNGEGRIQGGIATVPGFGWWPIKAYRPCPGFVASGGRYRRRGQNMDEVAFGRGGREASMTSTNEVQSK